MQVKNTVSEADIVCWAVSCPLGNKRPIWEVLGIKKLLKLIEIEGRHGALVGIITTLTTTCASS